MNCEETAEASSSKILILILEYLSRLIWQCVCVLLPRSVPPPLPYIISCTARRGREGETLKVKLSIVIRHSMDSQQSVFTI